MKDNFFTVFWFFLAVSVGVMLYHTSDDVHHVNKSIKHTKKQIAKEQHTIAVLNAEFYALTSLERMDNLTRKYLPELQPIIGEQLLSSIENLPEPPQNIEYIDNMADLIKRTLNNKQSKPLMANKASLITP